jgi:AcrR family transcriptional regulator
MPRIVKEDDYNQKRNQILDSATKFIYSIGFEQMSIQNITEDLNISKGAFYHYFDSKQDLLIGLINQLGDQIYAQVNPIIDDDSLTAIEKLNKYFNQAAEIKLTQSEYLAPIMKVWYTDDNAIVRERLMSATCDIIAPIFTRIILQGIAEGSFSHPYPERMGEVVFQIFEDMGDTISKELILIDPSGWEKSLIVETIEIYTEIFEKILNAPKGSITIVTPEILGKWINLIYKESERIV